MDDFIHAHTQCLSNGMREDLAYATGRYRARGMDGLIAKEVWFDFLLAI
jgi:hypothetical protein